ncbi:MAG TPA: DUF2851 family protein [Segetibacter sp.]|jgi:hypothetical protein
MTERLLQFIWQFQHFNKSELVTVNSEALQILSQGQLNSNQGPDFTNGKISIEGTQLIGNIELHINSSDWKKHNHSTDTNYSNIVLHVVWHNDEEIKDINGVSLPTLELQNLVPKVLLQRYENLMLSQEFVPSQQHLPALSALAWTAWKERLAAERLQRKSIIVLENLKLANNHWEEMFWWMLTRNFGTKVNADAFENIAKSISINFLAKHKNQIHQLEALLLGQAGFLDQSFDEDYPQLLKREHLFLQKKYKLKPSTVKPFLLRMRPANFPTIRLAQLAMLVHQSSHLFSKIKETASLAVIKDFLNVTANDYWHYHYFFDEPSEFKPKQLGSQMTDNIIINTVVPVLFAYGTYTSDEQFNNKAVAWLAEMKPEINVITKHWQSFGVSNSSALDSQALIELKNNYCNSKRCLECAVGNTILKAEAKTPENLHHRPLH